MHEQAEAVAPQVAYEWWMLCETHQLHNRFALDSSTETERKMSLECFLLHARNLYHFLTRRRRDLKRFEATDVLAEDFFDVPLEWTPATNLTFLGDKENMERLNRSLSHISYDRVDYERSKRWVLLNRIRHELAEAWNSFLDRLPEARRKWFLIATDSQSRSNPR